MRIIKSIFTIIPVLFFIFSCGGKEETTRLNMKDPFSVADNLTSIAKYDSSNKVILPLLGKYLTSGDYELFIDAVNRAAANYRKLANYDSAFAYVTKAMEVSDANLDSVNLHIAQTYYLLGLMYKDYQMGKESLLYLNKSLKIREALLQKGDPLIGDVYNNIGVIYYFNGKLKKALEYLNESLKLRKNRGFYDKSVGSTYMNIGNVYYLLNEIESSNAYYDTALVIQRKVYGENHPAIGGILQNMGGNFSRMGELDSALIYYKQALKIYKNVFGEDHTLIASTYNNIGLYYNSIGDYKNAISFYERSVEIKKKLGADLKKELLDNYLNLATAYRMTERYDSSIAFYDKALILISSGDEGFGQQQRITISRGLTLAYLSTGKDSLAFSTIKEAIVKAKEYDEENGFLEYRTRIYLSRVLNEMGKYDESINNSKNCLRFFKSSNNVSWTIFAYELLAEAYLRKGEYDKTLAIVEEIKHIFPGSGSTGFDIEKINRFPDVNKMISETLGMAGEACYNQFQLTKDVSYLDYSEVIYKTIIQFFNSSYREMIIESSKISESETIKNYLKTGIKAAYEKFVIEPDEENFAKALSLAEFGKALTALENVTKNSALITAKIPETEKEKIASLQKVIGYYSRLLSRGEEYGISDVDKEDYKKRLFKARFEYDKLNRELAEKYPSFNQFSAIEIDVSLAEIVDSILDKDQSAVECFLGDGELYSFVITPEKFAIVKQTLSENFENEVRALLNAVEKNEFENFVTASRKIYETVFKKVDSFIETPRVLIINDGIFGFIPYDILLFEEPLPGGSYKDLPYLIRKYSIGYAYSFNLLKKSADGDNGVVKFLGVAPFSEEN